MSPGKRVSERHPKRGVTLRMTKAGDLEIRISANVMLWLADPLMRATEGDLGASMERGDGERRDDDPAMDPTPAELEGA